MSGLGTFSSILGKHLYIYIKLWQTINTSLCAACNYQHSGFSSPHFPRDSFGGLIFSGSLKVASDAMQRFINLGGSQL